jgi:hypothetical protein
MDICNTLGQNINSTLADYELLNSEMDDENGVKCGI